MPTVTEEVWVKAPPASVFATLTTGNQLIKAFPLKSATIDPKVCGVVTLSGETEGGEFTDHGVVTAFEWPARFAYRYWSTNHGTDRTDANHMTIEYELLPDADGTLVRVRHDNLLTQERTEMMEKTWAYLLSALKSHVETR